MLTPRTLKAAAQLSASPAKASTAQISNISQVSADRYENSHQSDVKGDFESGHLPSCIIGSVFIEGTVLFDVEWKCTPHSRQPTNSLVTEDVLKKHIKPRVFKEMMKEYLSQESPMK